MPLDPSIYSQVGNFPSATDLLAQQADLQNRQQALKLQQGQLDQLPLHAQMLQMQLQGAQLANAQKAQENALVAPILSRLAARQSQPPSSQFTAGTNALGAGGAGPTVGAASAQTNALGAPGQATQQGNGVNFPMSFDDVNALKLVGRGDFLPNFKLALEGAYHPGAGMVTDVNGNTKYIPKLPDGMIMNADGSASNAPGFVNSLAETEGAKTGATERAKNSNTLAPLDRLDPNTGRPYNMTTAQLIDAVSPQPGSNLSGIPVGGRLAVAADAANRGVPLANATVNGQPGATAEPSDMPGIRADLAKAQASGTVADFERQHLDAIQKLPPEKRYVAMQGFSQFMQQNAKPDFAGFQGPAETAAAKANAEANVKLNTQPKIDYATDTAKAAAEYKGKLDDTVSTSQDLMQRVAEAKDALSKFTPGMGAEGRLQIARAAQSMGLPDSLVTKINNGDVAAKQEFVKLSAQTAMESLKTALGGSGRITQAEFRVFQQNNPNISLDPNAINKIYDFATKMYQRTLSEQQGYTKYIDQGGDPSKWRSKFAADSDPNASGNITIPGAQPKAGKANNDPLGLR